MDLDIVNQSAAGRDALWVIDRLADAGHQAVLAGGCVRDACLGRRPKDYDVATDAVPERVREIFGRRHTAGFGQAFGVIGVLPRRKHRDDAGDDPTRMVEVATFRSDGEYHDGRRPSEVHFGDAEADAARRDFTINGLFFDPKRSRILDYVGGLADLDLQMIRTIGRPDDRFGEDRLRMLRAIRFATTLGFDIDPSTMDAIVDHAEAITVVSPERIGIEMRRILGSSAASLGLRLLRQSRLAKKVWPSLDQADAKSLERFERVLGDIPGGGLSFASSLASWFLVDAPEAEVRQRLSDVRQRWRLSNAEHAGVAAIISGVWTMASGDPLPWSVLHGIATSEHADAILRTAKRHRSDETFSNLDRSLQTLEARMQEPRSLWDPPSILTGDDLNRWGVPAGPRYRVYLETIRAMQLDGQCTTKADAKRWVESQR